jgi:hypothetical protein
MYHQVQAPHDNSPVHQIWDRSEILRHGLRCRLNMADRERDSDAPRRVGPLACSPTKSFFKKYGMIFEKIDLESDIDIDAVLILARRGPVLQSRFVT